MFLFVFLLHGRYCRCCDVVLFQAPPAICGAQPAAGAIHQPEHLRSNVQKIVHQTGYAYRVLTHAETPTALRTPPAAYQDTPLLELRGAILEAVGFGNDPVHASLFLHATKSVKALHTIVMGRRGRYTTTVVRFPLEAINPDFMLDLCVQSERRKVICELPRDASHWEEECLTRTMGFSTFDQEVVLWEVPGADIVEWYDLEKFCWRPASDFEQDPPYISCKHVCRQCMIVYTFVALLRRSARHGDFMSVSISSIRLSHYMYACLYIFW